MSVTRSIPVVTKWVTITSMLDVSHMEGYCLYGTLLSRLYSACPVQIGAHHHIDVYTDINKYIMRQIIKALSPLLYLTVTAWDVNTSPYLLMFS